MRTKAAVLWGPHEDWRVEEIELGDPVAGEVQVQLTGSGLCHSDEHVRMGDMTPVAPGAFPFLGGHEGAGVVVAVGPEVRSISEGDHVVLSFVPSCGRCSSCATGHQNLCDYGAALLTGRSIADDSHRIHIGDTPVTAMCLLGTFSPYVTVHEAAAVRIDHDIPLDKAALVGCGVTTGWASTVYAGGVVAGDTVVVVGCGGIGQNAVQGARMAGAEHIVAVDPVLFKRDFARTMGATHSVATVEEAQELVGQISHGRMADVVVIAVGRLRGEHLGPCVDLSRKGGTTVVTAMGSTSNDVQLDLTALSTMQKRIQGTIFGGANPRHDIPRLLRLYQEGRLKLDELITSTYTLAQINQGYEDLNAGRNIRGVITFSDADR